MGTRRKVRGSEVYPGLGTRVREVRGARALNEVARAAGINQSQLSRFEREQLGMSIPRFMRLLEVLEVRAGDVLDPDIDSASRFLQLAKKVRNLVGTSHLQWLAELSKVEAVLAVEGAKKEVAYHRSQIAPAQAPAENQPSENQILPITGGKNS